MHKRTNDGSTADHQAVESLLNQEFRIRVQSTGGLIKQQNGWILQDGSCNGHALYHEQAQQEQQSS